MRCVLTYIVSTKNEAMDREIATRLRWVMMYHETGNAGPVCIRWYLETSSGRYNGIAASTSRVTTALPGCWRGRSLLSKSPPSQ
jgi:hypothetical protein